mmetsp:Transcript_75702/g.114023  ORF Transcript_75702/g.114023 Transcript_75702/m.114023 type:complete len:116 (+) Transcript_75702:926-1273(+)
MELVIRVMDLLAEIRDPVELEMGEREGRGKLVENADENEIEFEIETEDTVELEPVEGEFGSGDETGIEGEDEDEDETRKFFVQVSPSAQGLQEKSGLSSHHSGFGQVNTFPSCDM